MKPHADNEAVAMEKLLLQVQQELAENAEIAAGRLARLTLTNYEGEQRSYIVPFRVAAYMRKAMGAPALLPSTLRVVFTSRGITVGLHPTTEGYSVAIDALIAHLCAGQRIMKRQVRQIKAGIKTRRAEQKEGGATL